MAHAGSSFVTEMIRQRVFVEMYYYTENYTNSLFAPAAIEFIRELDQNDDSAFLATAVAEVAPRGLVDDATIRFHTGAILRHLNVIL